jgi:hypothetical protein
LNLQDDQPFVPISWKPEEGILTLDSLQVPGAVDGALAQFHSSQSGFLTSFIQSSAYLSYEQTGDQISDTNPTSPSSKYKIPCLHKQLELQKAVLNDPLNTTAMLILLEEGFSLPGLTGTHLHKQTTLAPGSFLSASAILCHPFPRGPVHTASKYPTAKTANLLQLLFSTIDLQILEDTYFFMQDLTTKEPLASL